MQRFSLIITLIAFSVLTALALWHQGYWGIIEPHFQSFGALTDPPKNLISN